MPLRSTTPASTRLFGIDIAGTIASAIASAGGVTPATLIKRTPAARTSGDPAGGTNSTEIEIPCQAVDERKDGDHAVTLLGASILYQGARIVPEVGDAISVRGVQLEVGSVEEDPAAATYTCKATGAVRVRR